MGVPKFYRWVSERYPCLSEIVRENQIPEFDNLYFDMNGIIHACSHPNDDDPHFRITEEKIYEDIFHYIEVLFRIIRPQKVFFMAVDGVAPRAKMNQQRGRRFMSAINALNLAEEAKKKGETLPTEDRFDSNCITPGTEFMAKLQKQLQYFVTMKISTDEMWQDIKIYLSGHDVPGEGEHKIMDFIRYSRSQPGYDANTRHCLYGLDADLIMLGLVSHEPHFSLLREEVRFVRPSKKEKGRTKSAEETTFHLLHLSLFREYIDFEFSELKDKVPFGYDLEKIIDDWALMGFLVGNDFIPHLPHLHIHEAALPTLYAAYCKISPSLGGYMNEGGHLNLPRFEKFLTHLSQFDRDHFSDEYADMKYLESKTYKEMMADKMRDIRTVSVPGSQKPSTRPKVSNRFSALCESNKTQMQISEIQNDELKSLIQKSIDTIEKTENCVEDDEEDAFGNSSSNDDSGGAAGSSDSNNKVDLQKFYDVNDSDISDEEEWTPEIERAFNDHKRTYYQNKMEYNRVTKSVLREQAIGYVTAIQWNLHYYYDGCVSWSWYYPHHYSPYLSDVVGFSDLELKFDLGQPFLPFQQLLAVLPAQSRKLLPKVYQPLMTDERSPIVDYYPTTFQTDLNGKKQDWEAVVLIPFIDEKRLLEAMKPYDSKLSDEEKNRNSFGKNLLFTTAPYGKTLPDYKSSLTGVFPDVKNNKAVCTEICMDLFRLSKEKILKGLLSSVKLDVYFFGFPTFKHIPISHTLRKIDVKVFQSNSRNESIVLKVLERDNYKGNFEQIAQRLIGQEIYVMWPHLSLGLACSLVTREDVFTKDGQRLRRRNADIKHFERGEETVRTKYFNHRAVDVGEINALIYYRPLLGTRYVPNSDDSVTMEKEWALQTVPFVLNTVVEGICVAEIAKKDDFSTVLDIFPENCQVFLMSSAFYGCSGRVLAGRAEKGRFRVRLENCPEPSNLTHTNRHHQNDNENARKKTLAVNPKVLFRPCLVTGNILPDNEADFQIFDRVVNVREGLVVPVGLRGTIVNFPSSGMNFNNNGEFRLDVIFDEEFPGALALGGDKKSGYRIPAAALLNLTYGQRAEYEKQRAKARGSRQQSQTNQNTRGGGSSRVIRPSNSARFPNNNNNQIGGAQIMNHSFSQNSAFQPPNPNSNVFPRSVNASFNQPPPVPPPLIPNLVSVQRQPQMAAHTQSQQAAFYKIPAPRQQQQNNVGGSTNQHQAQIQQAIFVNSALANQMPGPNFGRNQHQLINHQSRNVVFSGQQFQPVNPAKPVQSGFGYNPPEFKHIQPMNPAPAFVPAPPAAQGQAQGHGVLRAAPDAPLSQPAFVSAVGGTNFAQPLCFSAAPSASIVDTLTKDPMAVFENMKAAGPRSSGSGPLIFGQYNSSNLEDREKLNQELKREIPVHCFDPNLQQPVGQVTPMKKVPVKSIDLKSLGPALEDIVRQGRPQFY